ncbi:MAG: tetratricopeptide repeat protein [Myxococcales bacterium]|nr:tetratricopeptide repeat protein [Myxococcales bacterium]MCB9521929.1 tetratricopeptide repeat protein [Myxococcales bacterium]
MTDELAWRQYERGRRYELQGRNDEATAAYEAAVALDPGFPEAYFALARMIAGQGRHEAALPLLDRAVALRADVEILEWRAYVLGRLRRHEAALEDYRQVVEAGEGQARINLARMLLALRRYDEAEAELERAEDPSAEVLLEALPRYREFGEDESIEDQRAARYLFGRTVVLGGRGEGLKLRNRRFLLVTAPHVAVMVHRLQALARRAGWTFDGVAGDHAHHAPVADLVAQQLGLPRVSEPKAGQRVLLCSAVVDGNQEARRLRRPWLDGRCEVMHFALAFVPHEPPDAAEPDLIGVAARAAVPWYKVAEWSRLEADPEHQDGDWPGFRVTPPFVDPNRARVLGGLLEGVAERGEDRHCDEIVAWYSERHPQARAFRWGSEG